MVFCCFFSSVQKTNVIASWFVSEYFFAISLEDPIFNLQPKFVLDICPTLQNSSPYSIIIKNLALAEVLASFLLFSISPGKSSYIFLFLWEKKLLTSCSVSRQKNNVYPWGLHTFSFFLNQWFNTCWQKYILQCHSTSCFIFKLGIWITLY